jgi:Uma2 family endonuclease
MPGMVISSASSSLIDQQHIVLDDVSWDFYEHLLVEVGDRPIRITFDSGRLEIMAPLGIHEGWKTRIGQLIEIMCLARDIDVLPGGSTTFRRKDREKGLEPDECYYFTNIDVMRNKRGEMDMTKDPPPDLAVEIDITSRSIARQPIYAALGVPELWRFDGKKLTVLSLARSGEYKPQKSSSLFPFLPMDEFNRYLKRFEKESHNAVVRAFQKWVVTLP